MNGVRTNRRVAATTTGVCTDRGLPVAVPSRRRPWARGAVPSGPQGVTEGTSTGTLGGRGRERKP